MMSDGRQLCLGCGMDVDGSRFVAKGRRRCAGCGQTIMPGDGCVSGLSAPPPADADRELREAARDVIADRLAPLNGRQRSDSEVVGVKIGKLRRLRAALDRSPAVPAPPALDEEDTVELDAYILPVVASVRDAIRAEGQREEDDRDAELESALRGLVAALERKAGEASDG